MEQDHTRPYARDSHPTREELLFSEVEDFFGGAGPTELPIDTFAGSDIDLRKSGGDATEERPWQIFTDGTDWFMRMGIVRYRGAIATTIPAYGQEYQIPFAPPATGDEAHSLYLAIDLREPAASCAVISQFVGDVVGLTGNSFTEIIDLAWFIVNEDGSVTSYGSWEYGVVNYSGGDV